MNRNDALKAAATTISDTLLDMTEAYDSVAAQQALRTAICTFFSFGGEEGVAAFNLFTEETKRMFHEHIAKVHEQIKLARSS